MLRSKISNRMHGVTFRKFSSHKISNRVHGLTFQKTAIFINVLIKITFLFRLRPKCYRHLLSVPLTT